MSAQVTALGVVLKRLRTQAGLTQEELAARANLSTKQVSNLERGVCVAAHSRTLYRLVRALKLSAHDRALIETAAGPAGHGAMPHVLLRALPARAGSPPALTSQPVLQLLTEIAARQAMLIDLLVPAGSDDLDASATARPGGLTSARDNRSF